MGNRLWRGVKAVAHRIGLFQTWLMLTIFYGVCLMPVALLFNIFADPLHLRTSSASIWHTKTHPTDLGMWAKAQF